VAFLLFVNQKMNSTNTYIEMTTLIQHLMNRVKTERAHSGAARRERTGVQIQNPIAAHYLLKKVS